MSNRLESNDGWKRAKMSKLGTAVYDRRLEFGHCVALNVSRCIAMPDCSLLIAHCGIGLAWLGTDAQT